MRRNTDRMPGCGSSPARSIRRSGTGCCARGVVAVPDGFGGFVHNGAIHLIDADGTLRGIFDLDEWPQALERAIALTADLAA